MGLDASRAKAFEELSLLRFFGCCSYLYQGAPGYEPDDLKELKSYGQHNVAVCAFRAFILPIFSAFFTEKKLRKQQKSPRMRAFCYFNPQIF